MNVMLTPMVDSLSSDLALEDFLRRALVFRTRLLLERLHLPPAVHAARAYDAETDRLLTEIREAQS